MRLREIIKKVILFFLPIYQFCLVRILRHKKKINVVFFASSLAMWRYQNLYEAISKHPKFNAWVVIVPFALYTKEQQKADVDSLRNFLELKKTPYLLGVLENGELLDIKEVLKPDILFYPQPYRDNYNIIFESRRFYTKLLCYYPYAFWRSKDAWSYDRPYQNIAWKLFYSTDLHRKDAIKYSTVKGRNVEIVGYPTADDFLYGKHVDLWKPQDKKKKRVIWAPHYSIFSGGPLKQSNILWMADFMLEIANKYSDKIQFVFKPHPKLFSELCKHSEWGEYKAKEYYDVWETMENTQLQTGEFIDLFMTSDAMIHDSGSFGVEYHYSGNPVIYIANNFEEQVAEMAEFGQLAMRQHYVGKSKEDIIKFLDNVVLKGEDPMKEGREQFKKDYLLPPNGKTVAQNTMDILLKELC